MSRCLSQTILFAFSAVDEVKCSNNDGKYEHSQTYGEKSAVKVVKGHALHVICKMS